MTGQPIRCSNCLIIIRWQPTIVNDRFYCCTGCAQGGPCTCDYEHLPGQAHDYPIVPHKEGELTHRYELRDQEEW